MESKKKLLLLGLTLFLAGAGGALAQTTWIPGTPTGTTPFFVEKFVGTPGANTGQCGSGAAYPVLYGSQGAEAETWTRPIRMDMDNRSGGCTQQFGIYDPTGAVSGAVFKVNLTGDAGQCGNQGVRTIPLSSIYSSNWSTWSSSYTLDTDNRTGFCTQTFSLEGRSDLALDVTFEDEGGNGQCRNTGTFPVVEGRSATFIIDTDSDGGGCLQKFRLRLNSDADGDNVSDRTDNCPYDKNFDQADCDSDGLGDVCDSNDSQYYPAQIIRACWIQSGFDSLYTSDGVQYADSSSCNGPSYWKTVPGPSYYCGSTDLQTCCQQYFGYCVLDYNSCPY